MSDHLRVFVSLVIIFTLSVTLILRFIKNGRGDNMGVIIYTELLKIKRASMLKAGAIIVALSCVLSVIPVFARDSTVKNFALLMGNILENNCIYFSPVLTVLLGSYMMERETTDDTLKNMLTIPVTFQRILLGKLMVLLVVVSFFGVVSSVLGSLLGAALKLPGIGAGSVLMWSVRIICANILIFAAVLPITVLRLQGGRYAGRDRGCLRLRVPGLHRLEADELLSC